jgi:hypothetical protein
VRGERDEPALGKGGGDVAIAARVSVEQVARETVASVLANHDRPPFTRLKIPRENQEAPGEKRGVNIEDDVVSLPVIGGFDPA